MRLDGVRAIDARRVQSTGYCTRLGGSSCPWVFRRLMEALPANVVRGSAGHVDRHGRGTVTYGRRAPVRQAAPERGVLRCVASAFSSSTTGPRLEPSRFFERFQHGRPYEVLAASNPAEALSTLKQGRT